MKLHIVLNTQKIPYLIKPPRKNTCQIFLSKKISESKIRTPQNPLIIPDTLNMEYPSWVLHSDHDE